MDTQWPRFEVFKQDDPAQPHRSIGTVHAPDAELALLIARDVHVRRPECESLWVAPAASVCAITAEQLAMADAPPPAPEAPLQTYLIFQKTSQRRAMTFVSHVGEVEARSPEAAIALARGRFQAQAFVWWAVPASAITASDTENAPSWFAPARDKTYRQQSYYGDVGGLRRKLRQLASDP